MLYTSPLLGRSQRLVGPLGGRLQPLAFTAGDDLDEYRRLVGEILRRPDPWTDRPSIGCWVRGGDRVGLGVAWFASLGRAEPPGLEGSDHS